MTNRLPKASVTHLDCGSGFPVRRRCLCYCSVSAHCHLEHLLSGTKSHFSHLTSDSSLLWRLLCALTDKRWALPSGGTLNVDCIVSKQEATCLLCMLLLSLLSDHLRTLFPSSTLGILNGRPKASVLSEGAPAFHSKGTELHCRSRATPPCSAELSCPRVL